MRYFSYFLMLSLVIVTFSLANRDKANAEREELSDGIHVSKTVPVGTVVTPAIDLGGGIYLIQVEVGSKENSKWYPAVTAHPEQFPIGSKVVLKNVTVNGKDTFDDQFHIAMKP